MPVLTRVKNANNVRDSESYVYVEVFETLCLKDVGVLELYA